MPTICCSFYAGLLELVPEIKPLFRNRLAAQGKMLVCIVVSLSHPALSNQANVIKFVVSTVAKEDDPKLRKTLEQLAVLHNDWGIKADHYAVM